MRKARWFLITAVCLLGGGLAVAQNWETRKTTTTVPFEFVVTGTILPAGTYVIMANVSGHRLMIHNADRPEFGKFVNNANIILNSGATQTTSKLVFMLDNGQHVLHQVCFEGDNHTHDIVHNDDVIELAAVY